MLMPVGLFLTLKQITQALTAMWRKNTEMTVSFNVHFPHCVCGRINDQIARPGKFLGNFERVKCKASRECRPFFLNGAGQKQMVDPCSLDLRRLFSPIVTATGSPAMTYMSPQRYPLSLSTKKVSHELAPFVKRKAPALSDPLTSSGLSKARLARTMRLVEKTFSFARGQDVNTVSIVQSIPRLPPSTTRLLSIIIRAA